MLQKRIICSNLLHFKIFKCDLMGFLRNLFHEHTTLNLMTMLIIGRGSHTIEGGSGRLLHAIGQSYCTIGNPSLSVIRRDMKMAITQQVNQLLHKSCLEIGTTTEKDTGVSYLYWRQNLMCSPAFQPKQNKTQTDNKIHNN